VAPAAASGSASASAAAANGAQPELTAANLEVAILDRARAHRTFRRLAGPRLEELIAESRAAGTTESTEAAATDEPSSDDPPTGPPSSGGDGIPK
jgi:proteasome alpha subunit